MIEISKEQIKEHIINVTKYEFSASTDLMGEYKEIILAKSKEKRLDGDDNLDYVAKKIIGDMDRTLSNLELNNFDIKKIDLNCLVEYLISDNFPLKEILKEAISDKQVTMCGWGENIFEILDMNGLLSSIVNDIHILNLVSNDEKQNLSRKRDSKKVKSAIDTILNYSNDEQLKFYLQSIEIKDRAITTKTILSCIFCSLYKSIEESHTNKSKVFILDFTKSIMYYVFDDSSDYRVYDNLEYIKYKGYNLRKFIEKNAKNS